MNCYKCNSVLDLKKNVCTRCGADVRDFKRIVYMSNRYYNEGLIKAQARDLSGARDALRKSLRLYKRNTNARNLLGLVNYAMGESAEALKEWVISRNFSEHGNLADRYISNMQRGMKDLDSEGHGIRKFNQALGYCRNGAKDLAAIQLKKVVSVHSNMVKAYELLALLYIDDEKYDQARKTLTKCLEVDRGNASALHYLNEIDKTTRKGNVRNVGVVGEEEREQLIIPVRFRDYGSYLANALYILLGLFIGIAIAWFVILPGRIQQETGDAVAQARAYESEISALQESFAEKEKAWENETKETPSETPETVTPDQSTEPTEEEPTEEEPLETFPVLEKYSRWAENNEAITQCISAYFEDRLADVLTTFYRIDPEQLGQGNEEHYSNLINIVIEDGVYTHLIEQTEAAAREGKHKEAAEMYDAALLMHPSDPGLYFAAAREYEEAGDTDTAANRVWQVYHLFGDREESVRAEEEYKRLKGTDEVPPVTEDIDLEARRTNPTRESLLAAAGMQETAAPETPAPETPAPETPAPEPEPEAEGE